MIEGYREKCSTKTILGPKAERPLEVDIPIYITGMSFGALSYEAKVRDGNPRYRCHPPSEARARRCG